MTRHSGLKLKRLTSRLNGEQNENGPWIPDDKLASFGNFNPVEVSRDQKLARIVYRAFDADSKRGRPAFGRSSLTSMAPPATNVSNLNRVVVAFLDGTRLKGHVFNFSMAKDSFDLLPEINPLRERGKRVEIKNLKAVFFVKEFDGADNPKEEGIAGNAVHGKIIEVTFRDGEKIRGQTDSYNPQRLAFFIVPPGPQDNNQRILVVHKNAVLVRFV